ncbi:MAG: hypothetical protein JEZ08_15245 [Clostridiales bacterium]|nr:hypothetical protein [Clostridiales bacterium]
MIRKYFDKLIRIVYDDLKIFMVFFLFMQVGTMHISMRTAFVSTMVFSTGAFFINDLLQSDKFRRALPIIGIGCSFLITVIVYKQYTVLDKGALIIYHSIIWIASARNLRKRVMEKRTMMYIFMPIIVISLILLAVYFSGINLSVMLGSIYPYLLLFYAVTFMLAVKMNLDQGYHSEQNKTVNTINRRSNRIIYSYIPNLIILAVFIFVMSNDYTEYNASMEAVGVEVVESEAVILKGTPLEDDVVIEIREPSENKKKLEGDKVKDKWSLDFNFKSKDILKLIIELSIFGGILWLLYYLFKKTYGKVIDEDEEELLEVRESLLTRENISDYFKNLQNRFIKKPEEQLPKERALYFRYVQKLIIKGQKFITSETPANYDKKMNDSNLSKITHIYEQYRYGNQSTSDEVILSLEKEINDR